jgi:hypothetical protein
MVCQQSSCVRNFQNLLYPLNRPQRFHIWSQNEHLRWKTIKNLSFPFSNITRLLAKLVRQGGWHPLRQGAWRPHRAGTPKGVVSYLFGLSDAVHARHGLEIILGQWFGERWKGKDEE